MKVIVYHHILIIITCSIQIVNQLLIVLIVRILMKVNKDLQPYIKITKKRKRKQIIIYNQSKIILIQAYRKLAILVLF